MVLLPPLITIGLLLPVEAFKVAEPNKYPPTGAVSTWFKLMVTPPTPTPLVFKSVIAKANVV